MKKQNTRRALLMSALSILLCVSMLVGTTFAWFTDEVKSGKNIIAAGNLDVELFHTNDAVTDEKVTDSIELFTDVDKWEPGAVAYEVLTVKNVGNLALKYQLQINITALNGVEVDGKYYTLADALKVAVVPVEALNGTREAAIAAGKDNWAPMTSWTEAGELLTKDAADTYAVVIYWEPTANDNIFNLNNGKTTTDGGKELTIELGVHLVATQMTKELDSWGDDYDDEAWHPDMLIYTADDLNDALANGLNAVLMNNIELSGTDSNINVPEAIASTYSLRAPVAPATIIDLNGFTVTAPGLDAEGKKLHALVNNGNLVVKNGTIKVTGDNGGSAIYNAQGASLTLEKATVVGAPRSGSSWPSYAINSYGTLTIDGAVITSNHGALALYGDTVINNAEVTLNGIGGSSHVFYIGGEGTDVVVNSGTFTHKGNIDGSLAYIMTGTKMTINGGTFSASNGGYGLATYTGSLIVNGGTFANAFLDWGGPISISGGTFATKPNDKFVAEGFVVSPLSNGYAVLKGEVLVKDDAALNDAIAAGKTEIALAPGNYTGVSNSNIQIVGSGKETVITYTGSIENASVSNATIAGEPRLAVKSGQSAVFNNVNFEGTKAWGSVHGTASFVGCTFNGLMHIDSSAETTTIEFVDCTFGAYSIIKLGGSAKYVLDGCTVEKLAADATGAWGKEWLITYCNTTFTDCELGRVIRAGSTITIDLNNCVDAEGKAVTPAIVHKNASPVVRINGCEEITSANVTKPAAPLAEDFLFPAGTNAVLYKDAKLSGDAQIVHTENAVLGLSNVVAELDHDVIVRKSGGAIVIENSEFTLTDGAKLISVGEGGDAYQVFLINVKVNGVLLTDANAGQYLEGISWFQALAEWPNM